MQATDVTIYLVSLPLAQFKAIKRAVAVLVRAGMSHDAAIDIIVEQHRNRYQHTYRRVS